MAETVGLIGVGAMGQALLARLRLAGRQVRAFDVSEASLQAARDQGAETVDTAAAAASGAAWVHVFVRTDPQVIQATLSPDGVLAGTSPGTVVFLHSTTLPTTTRRVAEAAAARQVHVLDAPITAQPDKVRAGLPTFLVGGPDDLVARARAYLEPLGGTVWHFGPLGSGNVAKLAKNYVTSAERFLIYDAARIGEAAGLDVRQLLDMMRSVSESGTLRNWEGAFAVEDNHVSLKLPPNLFDKDVPLASEVGASYGLDLPVAREMAKAALDVVQAHSPIQA